MHGSPGGTWLFSEPQTHLTRLIDLTDLKWPALTVTDGGLQIAATCTVAQLDALGLPARLDRIAPDQSMLPRLPRFFQDLEDRNGRRQSLHVATGRPDDRAHRRARWGLHDLEGRWQRGHGRRRGLRHRRSEQCAACRVISCAALPFLLQRFKRRSAFRQISLTPVGRSAALLIGSLDEDGLRLTITASTEAACPYRALNASRCRCARRSDPRPDSGQPLSR